MFHVNFAVSVALFLLASACVTVPANPQPSPQPSATILPVTSGFEADFTQPDALRNWRIEDIPQAVSGPSSWQLTEAKLVQSSKIQSPDSEQAFFEGTRLITRQGPWYNARLRVSLRQTDSGGVGVIFRYQDADNYYRLLSVNTPAGQGPFTRLEIKQNGRFRTLAEDKLPLQAANVQEPARIVLTLVGPDIRVEVNEQDRFELRDNTFVTGWAGLATSGCAAEFSAFSLQTLRS